MGKVLVSACLLGIECRYNGGHCQVDDLHLEGAAAVPFCPEEAGGLPTPREPAEIVGGSGDDVLDGQARVVTKGGVDVTRMYIAGAQAALELCRCHRIKRAILKSRSPSCGAAAIYDGTFSGRLRPGAGVTGALLRRHGIRVDEH